MKAKDKFLIEATKQFGENASERYETTEKMLQNKANWARSASD